jgi:predicted transposase/invertase (TIGR01784 family)
LLFDTVSKHLIEDYSQDFATWLLGQPCSLTRLEPSELSLEAIRADALIYTGNNLILHLEIQTSPDPNIPFRLLDYRTRIYRKYPDKQVKQVVIYLKPTNSVQVYQTKFEIPGTVHSFEVVRLWEQPTELFLTTPGLLPLAVLSNTLNHEATLQQVARIIDQQVDPKTQRAITDIAAILAGLILDKELISRVLRRDIMQESVVYQEILQEGVQKGRQEGITQAKSIIAKNLLSIGIPVEQVAIATELSLEEIKQINDLSS